MTKLLRTISVHIIYLTRNELINNEELSNKFHYSKLCTSSLFLFNIQFYLHVGYIPTKIYLKNKNLTFHSLFADKLYNVQCIIDSCVYRQIIKI